MATFIGDNNNNNLVGTTGDDLIQGLGGNDTLSGLDGNDTIDGGTGDDVLNGGDGNDNIDGGTGIDVINGGDGNDLIASGTKGESIDGGAGNDTLTTLNLSDSSANLVLDLTAANQLSGDGITTIKNIESIPSVTTGSGNDTFKLTGNLLISNSKFDGGGGNDLLIADFSNATFAGLGTSGYGVFNYNVTTYIYAPGNSNSTLLSYSNTEQFNITGTAYIDYLTGYGGNDTINAGAGNDYLWGAAGDDVLNGGLFWFLCGGKKNRDNFIEIQSSKPCLARLLRMIISAYHTKQRRANGGDGNDNIDGGTGNDILIGVDPKSAIPGKGEIDNLTGGTGSDKFILGDATWIGYDDGNSALAGNNDYAQITDFNPTDDIIQLRGTSSDYLLTVSGSNTNLYYNKPGSEPDELIAVIQNRTGLNLTGNSFNYVSSFVLPSITLDISPASVTEDGTTNLVYTFTRTGDTTNPLTVNYTVDGTATFSTDYTQTGAASYTATTGTVTFAAGSSTATVTVDPTADTTVESNETVALTLTAGTDYTVGTTTAVTGTITNDDVTPSITGLPR